MLTGNQKADSGDFTAAIEIFSKAIELNPQLGEAYVNRSLADARLKDTASATALEYEE